MRRTWQGQRWNAGNNKSAYICQIWFSVLTRFHGGPSWGRCCGVMVRIQRGTKDVSAHKLKENMKWVVCVADSWVSPAPWDSEPELSQKKWPRRIHPDVEVTEIVPGGTHITGIVLLMRQIPHGRGHHLMWDDVTRLSQGRIPGHRWRLLRDEVQLGLVLHGTDRPKTRMVDQRRFPLFRNGLLLRHFSVLLGPLIPEIGQPRTVLLGSVPHGTGGPRENLTCSVLSRNVQVTLACGLIRMCLPRVQVLRVLSRQGPLGTEQARTQQLSIPQSNRVVWLIWSHLPLTRQAGPLCAVSHPQGLTRLPWLRPGLVWPWLRLAQGSQHKWFRSRLHSRPPRSQLWWVPVRERSGWTLPLLRRQRRVGRMLPRVWLLWQRRLLWQFLLDARVFQRWHRLEVQCGPLRPVRCQILWDFMHLEWSHQVYSMMYSAGLTSSKTATFSWFSHLSPFPWTLLCWVHMSMDDTSGLGRGSRCRMSSIWHLPRGTWRPPCTNSTCSTSSQRNPVGIPPVTPPVPSRMPGPSVFCCWWGWDLDVRTLIPLRESRAEKVLWKTQPLVTAALRHCAQVA